MKKSTGILVMLSFAAALAGCKESKAPDYNGVFTFIRGTVSVNGNAAKVGSKVSAAETINVGEKSGAVLQFANHAQLTLGAGTTIQVTQLMNGSDGKPAININQESGSTFSKVLAKGADYKMSTPTLVAGVRGTSFSVSIDAQNKNRVAIKLLNGKIEATSVSTTSAEAAKPVVLEAGQKIVADEKSVQAVEQISASERTALEQLESIKVVESKDLAGLSDSPEAASVEMAAGVEAIMTKPEESALLPSATEQPAAVKVLPLTIDQLKEKYGRLSKVTTNDGKTYIGSFSQKGGYIEVITTSGTVKIQSNNVQNIAPYEG